MTRPATRSRRPGNRSRRGVIVVLFAISLIVIVGLVAFAVDTGFMSVMKTNQQSSADAAALAGVSVLYKDGRLDVSNALDVAKDYYQRNTGRTVEQDSVTFQVGRWDKDRRQFILDEKEPNAMQVISTSSDLPTFFGRVLNTDTYRVTAKATALAPVGDRDIMFIMDNSTSMRFNSKIDMLREAIHIFQSTLESRPKDRVGLSQIARRYSNPGGPYKSFPGEGPRDHAELPVQLTTDKSKVSSHVSRLGLPYGFTNISEGMQLALQEFQNNSPSKKLKMAILLTDGTANRPPAPGTTPPTTGCTYRNDPVPLEYGASQVRVQANVYKQHKIPVIAISLSSTADQNLLGHVANTTEGVHIHISGSAAQQAEQLKAALEDIALGRYDAILVD